MEVWAKGDIFLNGDDLPVPENIPVPEAASYSIFNYGFVNNRLCHRRMDQCRNLISEPILSVLGGVNVIPTHLHIFEFFIPKECITEVVIPQIKKNMMEGLKFLTYVDLLVWCGILFIIDK